MELQLLISLVFLQLINQVIGLVHLKKEKEKSYIKLRLKSDSVPNPGLPHQPELNHSVSCCFSAHCVHKVVWFHPEHKTVSVQTVLVRASLGTSYQNPPEPQVYLLYPPEALKTHYLLF